jgi:hypothetical protein
MWFTDWATRIAFGLISLMLALLALSLIVYAGWHVLEALADSAGAAGPSLLDAVGYTIIAVAVFDVAKYLFEEETIRGRELRHAGEARRSLTKFVSTISIAVFLEAIVALFEAGKTSMPDMLYPTILVFAGVALIVGLGVYIRLSADAERILGGARGEALDEADYEEAREDGPPAHAVGDEARSVGTGARRGPERAR